jgi:hypothetical protein
MYLHKITKTSPLGKPIHPKFGDRSPQQRKFVTQTLTNLQTKTHSNGKKV